MGLISGSKTAESNGTPESARATARGKRGKKRRRPRKSQAAGTTERTPRSGGRDGALAEIEADLDRIIFRLMALGGMEEIEDELRNVRRLLYRRYSG